MFLADSGKYFLVGETEYKITYFSPSNLSFKNNNINSLVFCTSDKCYENKEWVWGYRETDQLGGKDPYSASKASTDYLVRAWYATHGLPVILTNCSNIYGPYHFPEK